MVEIGKVIDRLPGEPSLDLLSVAMGVFAADLRIPRKHAHDRWRRHIVLHTPVRDVATWEAAASALAETLDFLTGDTWELCFRKLIPAATEAKARPRATPLPTETEVALFSGGLDSLVGAIDLLETGATVALVGHHGAGITNSVQQNVLTAVKEHYGERAVPIMFHAQPRKTHKEEGEQTMRSRSFLFLAMGVAAADALNATRRLTVSENGFISLNVPLTPSRMGTLSTRTTHPHFVDLFRRLLGALSIDIAIALPGLFLTKGELLANTKNSAVLRSIAPLSMSCSHPEHGRFAGKKPGNHCGYCVPCIVRRASMVAAGLPDAEYDLDLLTASGALTEKGTRSDLRAFEIALARHRESSARTKLAAVLGNGPLGPDEAGAHADVYARGLDEIRRFLDTRV
ncbi:MAG: hypothetical protein HOW73_50260 [Polyangiaceae bacterium]|nr:hypothetical protein [Polyangiaceae bacterium]